MDTKPERINQGGVMRCCLQTLHTNLQHRTTNPPNGTILPCDHCTNSLIYHELPTDPHGTWRWNRPTQENDTI